MFESYCSGLVNNQFHSHRIVLNPTDEHKAEHRLRSFEDVNGGLFTYPMLMAADILLYDAHIIPVGKDKFQRRFGNALWCGHPGGVV